MDKKPKLLTVRLPVELHTKAKTYAYANGLTLQALIINLLIELKTEK